MEHEFKVWSVGLAKKLDFRKPEVIRLCCSTLKPKSPHPGSATKDVDRSSNPKEGPALQICGAGSCKTLGEGSVKVLGVLGLCNCEVSGFYIARKL